MTSHFAKARRRTLICGAAIAAVLAATPALAQAQLANIDIAAQPMDSALRELAKQSGANLLFSPEAVRGLRAKSLQTTATPEDAARMLLAGTDLFVKKDATGALLVEAADPQSGSAAGNGADGTVAALVVTAQKREENIQDVPIAISAFTEKSLQEQKIEGGFDLLKAIPNVTFSKNNFTSYNFSIRGIGTKAVSATTDPGVAVSFNNIALIQNRLFEQEYFDVERVEVLRGPQGTLYGRNATAGVINVISAKPNLHEFDGWVKGEVGNYHAKRLSAMVNVPLIEDKLALRFAGALTDRQGYDYNSVTKNHVNGRDLWSGRITVQFNPTERIRSNLIWERFNEDDNRSRTGKQLCHRDPGPTEIAGIPLQTNSPDYQRFDGLNFQDIMGPALFSQGCKPGSLYEDSAFGTPNGLSLPFVFAMLALGTDCGRGCSNFYPIGFDSMADAQTLIRLADPYGGMMQSRDLRTIASFRDPRYRAKADVIQFNLDMDLSDSLTVSSQTVYDRDSVYSFQDFNRFNTVPIFTDTSSLFGFRIPNFGGDPDHPYDVSGKSAWADLAPGGIFCDPQLGCSNTMAGFDISQAKSRQFSQELRLQSNFEGPINFSLGANYTKFNVLVDYYVMYNLITAYALMFPFNTQSDRNLCGMGSLEYVGTGGDFGILPQPISIDDTRAGCPYIDPNPVESINGEGHNYFRSKNPYRLHSAAAFGELYWKPSERLSVTAGLRYTDDKKRFVPVPTQVLLSTNARGGGSVNRGYPDDPPINQHWGEFTGRLGVEWKPEIVFTDQSMVYAFYSRGYKGGGANPPRVGFDTRTWADRLDMSPDDPAYAINNRSWISTKAVNYQPTFRPEFVNAFELGSKNTLLGGGLTLNGDVFLYDYQDYQVSKIVDRTAINENFDAKVWGAELEINAHPNRNFSLIGNLGYLDTTIGSGAKSIDIMNRTAGDPRYTVVKPWVQYPSNCVVPTPVVEWYLSVFAPNVGVTTLYPMLCGGFGPRVIRDPTTNQIYSEDNYPELNGGAGIAQDLKGNELPNSPHWTANIGAQYGFDFTAGWRATVRGDAYWQSQSWARVYNSDPYDKLHGWYNVNLSMWLENDEGLKIEFYAKNLLDKTPITDAFLNSDDTALTTNVFVLDPRLIGLSIRKEF